MATTKFYLDTRGQAKDCKGSVIITLFHNHSTSTFSTGIRVEPRFWNGMCVIKTSDAETMNAALTKRKSDIDRMLAVMSLEEGFSLKNATQIKREIECQLKQHVRGHLITQLIDEYISFGMRPTTKSIYEIMKKKLVAFAGDKLVIESIDYKWLMQFDNYLAQTQCANGRSIYLRALKKIFNYAIDIDINCKYPFRTFKIKQEETKKRCIEITKLCELYNTPTSERNAMFRDYFFLIFYLIGINVVDLVNAKKSQVVNGRLNYIRSKTGKPYSIKIEPEAQEIIDRYAGNEYLIEPMEHYVYYKSFLKELNSALKNIGTTEYEECTIVSNGTNNLTLFDEEPQKHLVPVVPNISTYYARHSWSTIAHELDISSDVVCMALGHSPGHKTTFIYIKPDLSKVDDANRKIIDYFKSCVINKD